MKNWYPIRITNALTMNISVFLLSFCMERLTGNFGIGLLGRGGERLGVGGLTAAWRHGRLGASAVVLGGEAYQRGFDIVKQTPPFARARTAARDEYIVVRRARMKGQDEARGLAQAAFGAVALDGAADLLGGGEAHPDGGVIVGALAHLDEHGPARQGRGLGGQQKVGALAKPLKAKIEFRHEKSRLSGENLKSGLWERRP
jgi:hypothetical protein